MLFKFFIVLFLFSLAGFYQSLKAQQAIINLPSADITPKNKLFVMNESFVRMWGDDNHWTGNNFLIYGVNKNLELSIANYNLKSSDMNNLSLAFGGKYSQLLKSELKTFTDIKLSSGYMLPISLQGDGVGYSAFSHLSCRLPKVRTRITTGLAAGTNHVYGRDIVCFIGGIEHPLAKGLDLVLEYFSGTHDYAGITTGFVYHHLKSDVVVVASYKVVPNEMSGDHGFIFELGKFFDFN